MAKGRKTGGGSRLGKPNKLTMAAKEAFQHAFDVIGGSESLAAWAEDNKTEFYKLFSKLIPADVNANLKGDLKVTPILNVSIAGNQSGVT